MIRVLIVDEAPLICDVIAAVLQREPDMEVVGFAHSAEEALAQLERCDVALVGAKQVDNGGLFIARALARANVQAKILVLGLIDSELAILRYLETGAAGYVLKDSSVEELLSQVRAVHAGKSLISPKVAALLIARVAKLAELCDVGETSLEDPANLTRRELEILALIREGLTNQEIADRLVLELGTVKNHVHSILKKLNVSNRQDAAIVATHLAVAEARSAS